MGTPDDKEAIGKRIRVARAVAGLTAKQLAALMDTTEPTISRWENGHVTVDAPTLGRLADVMKIPRAFLFGIITEEQLRTMFDGELLFDESTATSMSEKRPVWVSDLIDAVRATETAGKETAEAVEVQRLTFIQAVTEQGEAYSDTVQRLNATLTAMLSELRKMNQKLDALSPAPSAPQSATATPKKTRAGGGRKRRAARLERVEAEPVEPASGGQSPEEAPGA